jgi:hypothetical protein
MRWEIRKGSQGREEKASKLVMSEWDNIYTYHVRGRSGMDKRECTGAKCIWRKDVCGETVVVVSGVVTTGTLVPLVWQNLDWIATLAAKCLCCSYGCMCSFVCTRVLTRLKSHLCPSLLSRFELEFYITNMWPSHGYGNIPRVSTCHGPDFRLLIVLHYHRSCNCDPMRHYWENNSVINHFANIRMKTSLGIYS